MRLAVITLVLLVAGRASADDEIVQGAVLKVEHREIYVNVGAKQGVGDGAALRIKRTIALRHPVTRAHDHGLDPDRLGTASRRPGAMLSRAIVGDLIDAIRIGDVVEVLVDRPDAQPRPNHRVRSPPRARRSIRRRPRCSRCSRRRPASRSRHGSRRGSATCRPMATRRTPTAIRRDIDELHALREQLAPPTSTVQGNETVTEVEHVARASAPAGAAIPLVFVLAQPERVASAFLHYRTGNARTYRSCCSCASTTSTCAARSPRTPSCPRASTTSSRSRRPPAAPGSRSARRRRRSHVTVAPPPLIDQFASAPGKSSVKLSADYLDFATFDKRDGDHTDHLVAANVDFTYRLDRAVEAIGVGYGVYAGRAASRTRRGRPPTPPPQSGVPLRLRRRRGRRRAAEGPLSAAGQLIAGVGRDGFGLGVRGPVPDRRSRCDEPVVRGAHDRRRSASSRRSGSARVPHAMLLSASPSARRTSRTRATSASSSAPSSSCSASATSRVLVRGSWQGRTINHGGLGAGGGLGFYW